MTVTDTPLLSTHTLDTKRLLAALKNGVMMCARDEIRPVLDGIHIEIEPELLRFVSTDSYRLLVQELPTEGQPVSHAAILPRIAALTWIKGLTGLKNQNCLLTVQPAGKLLMLQTEQSTFTTEPVMGEFPTWRSLLPSWELVPDGEPCTSAAYDARFLSEIGKVVPFDGPKEPHVRLFPNGLKAMRFEVQTDTGRIHGAQMSVRVA